VKREERSWQKLRDTKASDKSMTFQKINTDKIDEGKFFENLSKSVLMID